MIRYMHAYFASNAKAGVQHPCGDGFRSVIVLDDTGGQEVTVVYPPTMEAATVSRASWMAIRPIDREVIPDKLLSRVERSAVDLERCGISFDRSMLDRIRFALKMLMAPPVRVRTRSL